MPEEVKVVTANIISDEMLARLEEDLKGKDHDAICAQLRGGIEWKVLLRAMGLIIQSSNTELQGLGIHDPQEDAQSRGIIWGLGALIAKVEQSANIHIETKRKEEEAKDDEG